jgi:hypothetical protein
MRLCGGVLALEVEGLGQSFPHLTGLDVAEGRLEHAPRSGRVPGTQRRQAFLDQLRAHELMVPRRRSDENVRDHAAFSRTGRAQALVMCAITAANSAVGEKST